MKKIIATIITVACFVSSSKVFAQGQVQMANNSTSLITNGVTGLPAAVGSTTFQLLFGTTSGSLAPFSPDLTSGIGTAAGRITTAPCAVNALTPSATYFFQIRGWQSTFSSFALAQSGGGFFGSSTIFQATASGPVITTPPLPTSLAGLYPGFTMNVNPIPEPSTMVLAGLGAASLLLFRRRKQA